MKILALALIFFTAVRAQALEYGCQLQPKNIGPVGSRMVKAFTDKKQSVPDSLVLTADFEGETSFGATPDKDMRGTLEGFYRPREDDFYSLLPIPALGISLRRERNMIYVCAHYDQDPKKTHATIYMLRGYHLDPTGLGTLIGDLFKGPQLQVKPLTASLVDISGLRRDFLFLLRWLPMLDLGLAATDGIQRLITVVVADFAGVGVERLTMTPEGVEIATGVDLKNPRKATIKKFIAFKKK